MSLIQMIFAPTVSLSWITRAIMLMICSSMESAAKQPKLSLSLPKNRGKTRFGVAHI